MTQTKPTPAPPLGLVMITAASIIVIFILNSNLLVDAGGSVLSQPQAPILVQPPAFYHSRSVGNTAADVGVAGLTTEPLKLVSPAPPGQFQQEYICFYCSFMCKDRGELVKHITDLHDSPGKPKDGDRQTTIIKCTLSLCCRRHP